MTIEHSRVFVGNRSQAVRLPKAVAFPPDVQGRSTVTLFDHPWPCTEAERYLSRTGYVPSIAAGRGIRPVPNV